MFTFKKVLGKIIRRISFSISLTIQKLFTIKLGMSFGF